MKTTFKKSLAAVLAAIMVLSVISVFPITAVAANAWDGTSAIAPSGAGTAAEPIIVSKPEHLAYIANQVNSASKSYEGLYILQICDIDMGGKAFAGIGFRYRNSTAYDAGNNVDVGRWCTFRGIYDGNGHTISNAVINPEYPKGVGQVPSWFNDKTAGNRQLGDCVSVGLFGAITDATVKNVVAKNIKVGSMDTTATAANVYSQVYAGVIVGSAIDSTIDNCVVDSDCSVCALWGAGGIVGSAISGNNITNCVNKGAVTSGLYAGGIMAIGVGFNCTYCINLGKVMIYDKGYSNNNFRLGGICGSASGYTLNELGVTNAELKDDEPVYTLSSPNPRLKKDIITQLNFDHCISAGELELYSTNHSSANWKIGGIFGYHSDCHGFSYHFNNCFVLISNIYATCKTNTTVDGNKAGTITSQVQNGVSEIGANYFNEIVNCQSVPMTLKLYDETNTTKDGNPWTKTQFKQYPLTPFVNAFQNDGTNAGSEAYWDNRHGEFATNNASATVEGIQENAEYKAIIARAGVMTNSAWDGTTEAPAGTGAENDPYLIASAKNFAWIAEQVNTGADLFENKYFKQTADIDFGFQTIDSIGWKLNGDTKEYQFRGNYDGANFKIAHAIVKAPASAVMPALTDAAVRDKTVGVGLFGAAVGGNISNIKASGIIVGSLDSGSTDADVYKNVFAGVIAGVANDVNITNCSTDSSCSVSAGWAAGGIVGNVAKRADISRCTNKASVTSSLNAGGIVGVGLGLYVSYCVNDGAIRVQNYGLDKGGFNLNAAGICGRLWGDTDSVFSVETFFACINGENATIIANAVTASPKRINRVAGILGEEMTTQHSILYSYCFNLAPVFIGRRNDGGATDDGKKACRGGAIVGQIGSTPKRTMEHCMSVNTALRLYQEGEQVANNLHCNTDLGDKSVIPTYPLAGMVNGFGDAGSSQYWTANKIQTNSYGEAAATIKSNDNYLAILSGGEITKLSDDMYATYKGCQESKAEDGKFDVRLVATVDALDYEAVGFKVTMKVGANTIMTDRAFRCTNVYDVLTGNDGNGIISYTTEDFGGAYLMALVLANVDAAKDVEITVTPYALDKDKGAQYGETYTITYSDGEFQGQRAV